MRRAYLDHNATTPMDPRAAEVMADAQLRYPGNPSSLHREGREARRVLEDARMRVAEALGVAPREVIFTGSATEAANMVLQGLPEPTPARRRVLASPLEHPCVIEPLERLEAHGYTIDWMPVAPDGRVDIDEIQNRGGDDLLAVVGMLVNNETGIIQDTPALIDLARRYAALSVTDLVQAPGKYAWTNEESGASAFFLSPHKFGGPRGLGILVVRDGIAARPLIIGGGQERERRAGTENVAAAVAAAVALELAMEEVDARSRHRAHAESRLLDGLATAGIRHTVNGTDRSRVAGVLSLRFPGHYGESLLMNLDLRGVAVSLGSACSSGSIEPSHVLRAMGLTLEENYSSLRVSIGATTTDEEVDLFVTAMAQITAGDDRD